MSDAYDEWPRGGERCNMHTATLPHRTLAERRELCGTEDVTLDGVPAMIMGAANKFAQVATLHIGGPAVEYAWPTVARIVASGGAKFWT
jgi:hypothetical protein